MADRIVVGLFPTLGRAEDVRSRLITEGVHPSDIEIRELREWERLPRSLTPEHEGGFFEGIFRTGLPQRYAAFLRNGESAVFVRADTDAEIETAVDTMRLFVPLTEIDVIRPGEEGPFLENAEADKP